MASMSYSSAAPALVVMTTLPDLEQARLLCRQLVEARMIARANVIPAVDSFYRWQDELIEDHECLVIMKTQPDQLDRVRDYLANHHPYDVPEFIALTVSDISEPYLLWLQQELS